MPWPTRSSQAETRRHFRRKTPECSARFPSRRFDLAVGSSIRWPCSMHFTPHGIAGSKRAYRHARSRCRTPSRQGTARNSASVKVDASSRAVRRTRHLPAVSLICKAPGMSCSRTRTRTSSGLSAIIAAPTVRRANARGCADFERLPGIGVQLVSRYGAGLDRCAGRGRCLRRWHA